MAHGKVSNTHPVAVYTSMIAMMEQDAADKFVSCGALIDNR